MSQSTLCQNQLCVRIKDDNIIPLISGNNDSGDDNDDNTGNINDKNNGDINDAEDDDNNSDFYPLLAKAAIACIMQLMIDDNVDIKWWRW